MDNPASTQAICVTPTRELAIQIVDKAVKPMAANMTGLKIELAIAGSNTRSVDAHLVVGTPGKIVDWLKRRTINPKTVKVFVLDEADNMVEEGGHRANSLLIKKHMPKMCQSLFFSATFPSEVVQFASKMVERPDKILIEDGPEFLVSILYAVHGAFVAIGLSFFLFVCAWMPLNSCIHYLITLPRRYWMLSNSFGSILVATRGESLSFSLIFILF